VLYLYQHRNKSAMQWMMMTRPACGNKLVVTAQPCGGMRFFSPEGLGLGGFNGCICYEQMVEHKWKPGCVWCIVSTCSLFYVVGPFCLGLVCRVALLWLCVGDCLQDPFFLLTFSVLSLLFPSPLLTPLLFSFWTMELYTLLDFYYVYISHGFTDSVHG